NAQTDVLHVLGAAEREGGILGNCISTQGWSHIHFIAHSAGAALIQGASEAIKNSMSSGTVVHTTFLDAYVGATGSHRSVYGNGSDWTDSYFCHDLDTLGEYSAFTEGPLDHAYNVDVTFLDPLVTRCDPSQTSSGSTIPYFCNTSTHSWPHEFYTQTVPPRTVVDAGTFGFSLSKE